MIRPTLNIPRMGRYALRFLRFLVRGPGYMRVGIRHLGGMQTGSVIENKRGILLFEFHERAGGVIPIFSTHLTSKVGEGRGETGRHGFYGRFLRPLSVPICSQHLGRKYSNSRAGFRAVCRFLLLPIK